MSMPRASLMNDCSPGPCHHTEDERTIRGTFFTGEIHLALQHGYKLLRVDELWDWPPEQRTDQLFRELILTQYRKKAVSSAAPADAARLQELIDEYRDTMGLEIQPDEFMENAAQRTLAKFSLNNIW